MTAPVLDTAPAPVSLCPGCGHALGDRDRVTYGVCSPCRRRRGDRFQAAAAVRRCWCGRPVPASSGPAAIECAEHDH